MAIILISVLGTFKPKRGPDLVSGPSPDAEEAVELYSSQIRAVHVVWNGQGQAEYQSLSRSCQVSV
jgi:hypothetical protein